MNVPGGGDHAGLHAGGRGARRARKEGGLAWRGYSSTSWSGGQSDQSLSKNNLE